MLTVQQQEQIKSAEALCKSTYETFRLASRKPNNEAELITTYRQWHSACGAKKALKRLLNA